MTVPVKIIIKGDRVRGESLLAMGARQMAKLENLMQFQSLDQYTIRYQNSDGDTIVSSSIFGLRTTEITTSGGGGGGKGYTKQCLCNCNFTHGYIKEVKPDKIEDFWQLYDVLVCKGKRVYVLYEDILASDFTVYEEKQKVILIPYNTMSFNCCEGGGGASGCAPKKSEEQVQSEDWRTTLRIIPWCGFSLPKWIQVRNNG
jgi:hypothetical protein